MYKYKLYYDGGFLRDSSDLEGIYESEEEVQEEADLEIDSRVAYWASENVDYDVDLFEIVIEEV